MTAFLRTLWKDMLLLRWWLLAWTSAVIGFAVWRDGLIVQWESAPVDNKPDADTPQKVFFAFAAVLAVRLMHTDKLQGEFAFWRTRPTSAVRLAVAKLFLAFLWLFLLPCAVEYVLLRHWGWGAWSGPCVATLSIALASVLVPALCVAGFIPVASIAMPAALLLAWFSYSHRPGDETDWNRIPGTLAPAFWAFYARTLLGLAITLLAAAARWSTALLLAVLMLIPFPKMDSVLLPDTLDPMSPARMDGPAPSAFETSTSGDRIYLRLPDSNQPVWATNSRQPMVLDPADGSEPLISSPGAHVPWRSHGRERVEALVSLFPHPADDFPRLFLHRLPAWGEVKAIPYPDFRTEKRGRVTFPVRYGTLDEPIRGELPLVAGSDWRHGPCRITLVEIATSKSGPAFRLRFELPHSRTGQWRTSLHGTGCSTNIRIGIINRRLGLTLGGQLHASLSSDYRPTGSGQLALLTGPVSAALYRQTFERCFYPHLHNLEDYLRGARKLDGELFRDAVIVFAEWTVTERGEKTFTLDHWPPAPRIPYNDTEDLAGARLKALQPPPLDDETAVRAYVDELIQLRGRLVDQSGWRNPDARPDVTRFTLLGSRWLPLIVRRIAVGVPGGIGGYDYSTKGERSEWIDILASRMAEPAHGEMLLELMRGGLPLPRTIRDQEWFRHLVIPELPEIAARSDQGYGWLKVMLQMNDPALKPAIVAWFGIGYVEDRVSNADYLWDIPGFPHEEVLSALQGREGEMLPSAALHFALLKIISGMRDGLRDLEQILYAQPSEESAGGRGISLPELLQQFVPECPGEPQAAIGWLSAQGARLQKNGGQWRLPAADAAP